MDILDFLNSAYGKMVVGAGAIGLIIIYVIVRAMFGLIYYGLFPSKRNWRIKLFEEEAEENRNRLIFDTESIGSLSVRLGEDTRDVWEIGYSKDQVNGVLTGKYTLEEMYKMEPEGNTTSIQGKKNTWQ